MGDLIRRVVHGYACKESHRKKEGGNLHDIPLITHHTNDQEKNSITQQVQNKVRDGETISRVKITVVDKRSTFVEINRGNENPDLIHYWCSKAQIKV